MTEVFNLFPIPVFSTELNYPVDKIETLCQQERLKNSKGVIKSNLGGWQSGDINYPDSPFSFLLDIEKICQEYAENVLLTDRQLYMGNAWININQKDNSNIVHVHPGCDLSGVYYVKTPEECGNLVLLHPGSDLLTWAWGNFIPESNQSAYSSPRWWLPAKANTLYIFPSWLKHSVQPNMSDEERISISFNFSKVVKT